MPWQVIELVNGVQTRCIYAESVDIKVNTKTEKSTTDKSWWNIACHGFLKIENSFVTITDTA